MHSSLDRKPIQKITPKIILRRLSSYINPLLLHRMDEYNAPCVEGYTSIRIGACSTIFQIPFDMYTDCRKLRSYLMVASRVKLYLQQVVVI